eukprot:2190183-Ditylum_brightwellii.AAC.2
MPGKDAIFLHSKEEVIQGVPGSIVGYEIILVPLAEQMAKAEGQSITPLYADDESVDGPARCNARVVKIFVEKGPDQGYFPAPEKNIHICNDPAQFEVTKRIFAKEGLSMIIKEGQHYIGGFIESEATMFNWVTLQVEKWADGVRVLAKFAMNHTKTAYAGL